MTVEVILRLTNLAIQLGCQTVVGQGMAKPVKEIFRNLNVELDNVNIILNLLAFRFFGPSFFRGFSQMF
jgi:hypothetical protein